MADQNVRSTNGFCLIFCLAAYAWVRIIRVRVQPWYESFTLLVSGQVTKQQSSFRRIRRKVTFLSGMSQRGRFLISNMLFHGAKNHMVSEAYFQFSSKIPKRHWEFRWSLQFTNMQCVFKWSFHVWYNWNRFSSALFFIYLFPRLFKTRL